MNWKEDEVTNTKLVPSETLSPGKFQQGPKQYHQLGGIFKSLIPRAMGGSIEEQLQNTQCELQGSRSREEFRLSL